MRGNSCRDERHMEQCRRLPKEVGSQEAGRPRRPGLPEGIGGFPQSGGVKLPKTELLAPR